MIINKLIVGVTRDMESFKYNTAIAKMMESLNKISNPPVGGQVSDEEMKTLIKLMAPMAPYMAEEWWQLMGEEGSVHASAWPEAEEEYLVDKEVVVAAAINGKVRAEIRVGADDVENRNKVIDLAKTNEKIQKWLSGSRIVKEIYVPGKMINFVVVTEG